MKRLVVIAGLASGLAGCTCAEPETSAVETRVEEAPAPLACDAVPDRPVAEVATKGMRGRALLAAQRPVGILCDGRCDDGEAGRCTGFLVTEDLFLTTRSCLGGEEDADLEALGARARSLGVRFGVHGDEAASAEADADEADPTRFTVTELVEAQRDATVDYALLRLKRAAGRRWGLAVLAAKPDRKDRLVFVHHPDGGAKRIAEGTWEETAAGALEVAVSSGPADRGAPLLGHRDHVEGVLREPGDCEGGQAATVTTVEALRAASPTLANLVTIRHAGNRTTYGTLEVYCGDLSCRRGPSFCGGRRNRRPCCDVDRDGRPDEPPTCWEANELGCSVECAPGERVTWACSVGASDNRFVETVALDGGEVLAEDCGKGCDGTVQRDGGYVLTCDFNEYR